MGIFDALTTAVAGLQAQSFALQNISGNIANSQTTGYKEINTGLSDLVSQAAQLQQNTNGVIAPFGGRRHGASASDRSAADLLGQCPCHDHGQSADPAPQ